MGRVCWLLPVSIAGIVFVARWKNLAGSATIQPLGAWAKTASRLFLLAIRKLPFCLRRPAGRGQFETDRDCKHHVRRE